MKTSRDELQYNIKVFTNNGLDEVISIKQAKLKEVKKVLFEKLQVNFTDEP